MLESTFPKQHLPKQMHRNFCFFNNFDQVPEVFSLKDLTLASLLKSMYKDSLLPSSFV